MSNKIEIGTINDKTAGKVLDFTKVYSYSPPRDGFFHIMQGDYPKKSHYYQCRESFARRFQKQKNLGFHIPRFELIEPVKQMIKWVETQLNIPASKRCKFQVAKMKAGYMLVITAKSWWKTNELRRQILTAIIRESIDPYNNGMTPEEKINDSDEYFYSAYLKASFNKFLKGYTHTDKKLTYLKGWMHNFNSSSAHKHLFKEEPVKKSKKIEKNS